LEGGTGITQYAKRSKEKEEEWNNLSFINLTSRYKIEMMRK